MKKVLIVVSPLLIILVSILAAVVGNAATVIIMALVFLCFPLIHFLVLSKEHADGLIGNAPLAVSSLLLLISEIISFAVIGCAAKSGGMLFALTVLGFTVLCGAAVFANYFMLKKVRGTVARRVIIIAEALVLLVLNSVCPLFSARLSTVLSVEYAEIPLMTVFIIGMAVVSYFIGSEAASGKEKLFLAVWLVFIALSEFVSLWMIGTPREIPFASFTVTCVWIAVSVAVFVPSLIGFSAGKRAEKQGQR